MGPVRAEEISPRVFFAFDLEGCKFLKLELDFSFNNAVTRLTTIRRKRVGEQNKSVTTS